MKELTELIKALGHENPTIQQDAAESLGMSRDERATEPLIQNLKDKNKFVRKEVIMALGKIGGTSAVEPLTNALRVEKDEFVKRLIENILETLQS